MILSKEESIELFRSYIKLTGVASLEYLPTEEKKLFGKKVGIINGSSWVTLWSNYFANKIIPGVKLINIGNEAIQLNFMTAHSKGLPCPPQINIEKTCNYARDLCELFKPDVILLTCSTMNRSAPYVREAVKEFNVPVVQIDEPMMEKAAEIGNRMLVVATHGPTVESTTKLLDETLAKQNRSKKIQYFGAIIEDAFHRLGIGDIEGHNRLIAEAIADAKKKHDIDCVILAQLSMSIFKLEHPDPLSEFGTEVLTSGELGFTKVREILLKEG